MYRLIYLVLGPKAGLHNDKSASTNHLFAGSSEPSDVYLPCPGKVLVLGVLIWPSQDEYRACQDME